MQQYDIVAVLWNDHTTFHNATIPEGDLGELILPSLTVGVVIKDDADHIAVMHHLEKYSHGNEADFTVIMKSAIIQSKFYGKIELNL